MMTEGNFKIENTVHDSKKTEKEGLSEYSWELINETRDLLVNILPNEEGISDQEKLAALSINKELARTCIVALLEGMKPEERNDFRLNPRDFKGILLLSVEKVLLSEEVKQSIREKIRTLTFDDSISQSSIIDKLDLLELDGDVCKMSEALYESFKKNTEAVQAHAYMNLMEQ